VTRRCTGHRWRCKLIRCRRAACACWRLHSQAPTASPWVRVLKPCPSRDRLVVDELAEPPRATQPDYRPVPRPPPLARRPRGWRRGQHTTSNAAGQDDKPRRADAAVVILAQRCRSSSRRFRLCLSRRAVGGTSSRASDCRPAPTVPDSLMYGRRRPCEKNDVSGAQFFRQSHAPRFLRNVFQVRAATHRRNGFRVGMNFSGGSEMDPHPPLLDVASR